MVLMDQGPNLIRVDLHVVLLGSFDHLFRVFGREPINEKFKDRSEKRADDRPHLKIYLAAVTTPFASAVIFASGGAVEAAKIRASLSAKLPSPVHAKTRAFTSVLVFEIDW